MTGTSSLILISGIHLLINQMRQAQAVAPIMTRARGTRQTPGGPTGLTPPEETTRNCGATALCADA